MTWLIKLLGGSKLASYFVYALCALVAAALLYGSGFFHGYLWEKGKQETAALTEQVTVARGEAFQLTEERRENSEIVGRVAAADLRADTAYRNVRAEAQALAPIRTTFDAPPTVCVVGPEYVRVWNDATTAGLPEATGGASQAAARTGSTPGAGPGDGKRAALEPYRQRRDR